LVSYTSFLQRRSWGFLVVSGIAAGLALLTRSVNGVLLPLMVVLTLFDIYRRAASEQIPIRGQVRFHFVRMIVWGLIALATVFALWPALWVAPIDTIDQLVRGGSTLASAPHTRQLLFRGQVTGSDPGWSYYLVVLAYRLSPLTAVALVLSTFGLLAPRVGAAEPGRRLCFNLAVFAAAYFVILSFAAKKLDRYLLPTLAALDLIAVIGTIALVRYLVSQRAGISRYVATGIAVAAFLVLLGGQAVAARESAPYYITYVSPLMGGQSAARRSISLEWGEGGKAVAETILQHPEITPGTIAGGAWPRAIDYYLPFPLLSANHDLNPAGAAWFMQSQYVVVTEPEIQRQFYALSMIVWFDSQSPVAVIQDDGRVYARIYDLSGLRVPEPYYQPDAPIFTWRGQATLVGSVYREQIEVGSDLRLRLFFETGGQPFYYRIDARVVDSAGNVVGEIRKGLRAESPVPSQMRSIVNIDLPDDLPPGTYQIQIRMRDGETHETVQAVRAAIDQNARSPVTIGSFEITTDIPENGTPVDAES
ncbi:MAG TPA: hypothetical protein VHR64_11500, partial [Thermomicrobiales bacterium]|nr:hypothetical protein [Thermomicrobiales bacterium]